MAYFDSIQKCYSLENKELTKYLKCYSVEKKELMSVELTQQETFYKAAVECYKRGIPVIPIPAKEKGTKLKDWQNLASTDPDQLGKWKKANPQGNAGAVCKSDGICVVDWDEPALIATLPQPLPATFTVKSSKGLHSYFWQTDSTRALGNKNVSDPADPKHHLFDFQQHNKYVVAPNSIHPSGAVYTIMDASPIVDCPTWLVEWMKTKAEKPQLVQTVQPQTQALQPKSNTGTIISKYGEPITREQFENWLTLHNESFIDEPTYNVVQQRWQYIRAGRCPWQEEHTNKNASKDFAIYYPDNGPFGVHCVHSHEKTWDDYRNFLIEQTGHNFSMKTGEIVSATDPEIEYVPEQPSQTRLRLTRKERKFAAGIQLDEIIPDLIARDTYNIMVGESGIGKTPLALQLALCVAFGKDFLGIPVKRTRVMFIDYENGDGLPDLEDMLIEHLGINATDEEWDEWYATTDFVSKQHIEKEISEFKPGLILIDALRGYDLKAETVEGCPKFINEVSGLSKKYGCASIFIHHPRKSSLQVDPSRQVSLLKDPVMVWMEKAAGASGLCQQAYTRIGVIPSPKDEAGELAIRGNMKGKGDIIGPWFLGRAYNNDGNEIGYYRITGKGMLSHEDQLCVDKLPIGNPLHFGEIHKLFPNLQKMTVSRALTRLENAGVVKADGPRKSHTRTYTRISEVHAVTDPEDLGGI